MPLVRIEVCCRTSKANGIAFMRLADQPLDENISLPVQPLWQSNCEASSDAVDWWRAPVELRFNWVLQRHTLLPEKIKICCGRCINIADISNLTSDGGNARGKPVCEEFVCGPEDDLATCSGSESSDSTSS